MVKTLEIQTKMGLKDLVQPHRKLIKEGVLYKDTSIDKQSESQKSHHRLFLTDIKNKFNTSHSVQVNNR